MTNSCGLRTWTLTLMCALVVVFGVGANIANAQGTGSAGKTRLAAIGLDHDHVWSLLKDMAGGASGELIGIGGGGGGVGGGGQKEGPAGGEFFSEYVGKVGEA